MRVQGWEEKLAEVLRDASTRPYDPQTWNCAKFAHKAAEAITGRSIPFRLRRTLERSVDAVLPRVEPAKANRGDVVMANVPEPSLGVCLGRTAAFVTSSGLLAVTRDRITAAWEV